MPADTEEVRAEVERLLRSRPPMATTLSIERYLAIPPTGLPAEVLDQLLADELTGGSANERPGRALRWLDGAGRALVGIDVHPVRPDFEDALLPHALAAVAGGPLALEIRCATGTILDSRVVAERRDGRDLLGQLEGLGWQVSSEPGAVVATREQVSRAQPWILAFLPLVVWVVSFLLLFARRVLWNLFGRALRTRKYRLTYRFEAALVRARHEGDGAAAEEVEVPTGDLVAVSFAPSGCVAGPKTTSAQRAISKAGVVRLPVNLPDLPRETGDAMGRALKELLQVSALRARARAGAPVPIP